MDLTIKDIPTEAIKERIISFARSVIFAHIETPKELTKEKLTIIENDKNKFDTANNYTETISL